MAKFHSPLLGYNNNVKHKGRLFHIQTEDSGVAHPHVITHLFMDGGRILKSVKRSYAEHVGSDGMKETVRQLMKEQHKGMFIALRDGQFDHLIDPKAAPGKTPPAAVPPPEPSTTPDVNKAASAPTIAETPAPHAANDKKPSKPAPRLVLSESQPDSQEAPKTTREVEPPSAADLTLDFDAFERKTGQQAKTKSAPPPGDGKRAPSVRPAARGSSRPGARTPSAPPAARPPSQRPPESRAQPRGDGRYAPARPAAIFGSLSRPQAGSIFGDELISDKSLDEVILGYLAEDLEPPRRDKK